jgi:outer membrane protein assembly factor BamD
MISFAINRERLAPRLGIAAIVSLAVFALSGCGNRNDAIQEVGADQLYEQGAEHLRKGNYAGAIATFQNLELRYPFSPRTRQAQLDLIYAYYRSDQRDQALDAAETFVRENPRLPEVAYCLYMIGVIHFDRAPNIIERLFKVDISRRPPKETQDSFDSFQMLIREYPDSPYVEDARQRMVYLRNRLATYENHVARYYLTRGAYVAAIDRAKYAIEHYPGAPQLEETLSLMIEAYDALGMRDLADDARRVLQESFGDLQAGDSLDD